MPRILPFRFAVLLGALSLLLVATPLVDLLHLESRASRVIIDIAFVAMLLSAVFAAGRTRRTRVLAWSLAVPAVVFQFLSTWITSATMIACMHVAHVIFICFVVCLLTVFLFSVKKVDADLICASICAYLLIGVLFALAYSLVQIGDSEAFAFSFGEPGNEDGLRFGGKRSNLALYYSFVTMSTLGYGDIVPASTIGRVLASFQALVGQLYLVVLVARLVGLHISPPKTKEDDNPA